MLAAVFVKLNNLENNGNVSGVSSVGGIVGHSSLVNSQLKTYKVCCDYYYAYHEWYGASLIKATALTNKGAVAGNSKVGELFGICNNDSNNSLPATISGYTVLGSIILNGEVKEGTYDIGSSTYLTLSGRVVYVPETPEDETNSEENTETTPET